MISETGARQSGIALPAVTSRLTTDSAGHLSPESPAGSQEPSLSVRPSWSGQFHRGVDQAGVRICRADRNRFHSAGQGSFPPVAAAATSIRPGQLCSRFHPTCASVRPGKEERVIRDKTGFPPRSNRCSRAGPCHSAGRQVSLLDSSRTAADGLIGSRPMSYDG